MKPETAAGAQKAGFTVDVFHRGAFRLVQPAGRGHRAGMDAMVLAAAVPAGFRGRLADLGAGAGAAGLAVAARCALAQIVLVEQASEMADCARATLALPENAELAARAQVLEADATLTGQARIRAGLADAGFDHAIMNPPFNEAGDRRSPDALRRAAHVMEDGLFEGWIRTAAAIVRPGGGLALIARPQSLGAILAALERRFGDARLLPVQPRPESPAIRIVLTACKGSRKPLSLHPPLILHEAEGEGFTARAQALLDGETALFAD